MVWQLWHGSRGMGDEARLDDRLRRRLPRILAACAVMGAVLWGGSLLLAGPLSLPLWRWAALAALIAAGMVSYAGAVLAFRAYRLSDLRAAMRRQR